MNRASHGSFCGKNGKFRVEVRPSAFFISSFFMREPDFFRQLFLFSSWQAPRQRTVSPGDVLLSASSGLLAAVIYTILYFLSKKSMGTGDIFLSAGAACWLTPVTCLLFIWFSALTALLFSAYFLLTGKWNRKSPVRFGPFMALGGILAYGMEIWLPLPPGLPFG